MPVPTTNPVIKEMLDALGLEHVTAFEIKFETKSLVAVNVTLFPTIDGLKQFPAILKKYKLVPRDEVVDVSTLGTECEVFQKAEDP
jgi:hypothetical protein